MKKSQNNFIFGLVIPTSVKRARVRTSARVGRRDLAFFAKSKLVLLGCLLLSILALTGCRAHMLTVRLVNTSAEPLSTIIVDYPSATFGKDKLAPGETFSSTVKITDSGPLKLQFTDAHGAIHTFTGLVLHANNEGSVDIKLDQGNADVEPHLASH